MCIAGTDREKQKTVRSIAGIESASEYVQSYIKLVLVAERVHSQCFFSFVQSSDSIATFYQYQRFVEKFDRLTGLELPPPMTVILIKTKIVQRSVDSTFGIIRADDRCQRAP